MKRLDFQLKRNGKLLVQVKREGRVAMYLMEAPCGYEVIVIRDRPTRIMQGIEIPAYEAYPHNNQWGKYGWTYKRDDRAGAEKRFAALLPKWGSA